jgi:hypothetical protein
MSSVSDNSRGATPPHARGACPACGWRLGAAAESAAAASLPMSEGTGRREVPSPRARLVPMDTARRDAGGLPRATLVIPGHRLPTALPSLAAALAAEIASGARA